MLYIKDKVKHISDVIYKRIKLNIYQMLYIKDKVKHISDVIYKG